MLIGNNTKSQPRKEIIFSTYFLPVSISAVNQYVFPHYYVFIIGRQINTFSSLVCIASQANTLLHKCAIKLHIHYRQFFQCLKIRSSTG